MAPLSTSGVPVARAPAARSWEHKMVDITTLGRAELKLVLDKEGGDGWELAAIDPGSASRGERTAIFKRIKPVSVVAAGGPGGMTGMAPAAGASGPPPSTTVPTGGARYGSGSAKPDATDPTADPAPAPATTKLSLHTIPLQAATATNAAAVLKELMVIGEFPGVTAVIADADTNSLIVKAGGAGLKAVSERAKKLDEAAAAKQKEDAVGGRRKP